MGIFDPPVNNNTANKNSSIFESFKPISDNNKSYIDPTLKESFVENKNYSVKNPLSDRDFQSDFQNAVNSFRKGMDQTQISNYQGKSDAFQEIIDNNIEKAQTLINLNKQGQLDDYSLQNELSIIENQNNEAQEKVSSFNQDIKDNKEEINNEYVSKLYQLKEAAVQAKGGDSGLWESVKYTMPSIVGSSASLMGQQLAATFGTGLIKKVITAAGAGAIGGPVGEFITVGGTLASTLGLLVNSRYQETMAELGGQLEENQQKLLEKWQEENPLSEPDENVLRKIRIESRKGKDNFVNEQMMLTIPDAIEATIMPGSKVLGAFKTGRKFEQSLKAIGGYNNATRIGSTLAKGYTNYLGEKFEEGYQYATGKRFASEALGLNNYEDKGFISNVLSDSYDVLSSISYGPYGTLKGDGRYSEDKEFQFAEQSGGLLAAITGGLASGVKIAKDIKTFRDTNKELQSSGIANPEDKWFRLKDQIYAKHFDNNTVEFLLNGVRNLEYQKDENGVPMLTKEQAQSEVNNIKDAFDKYSEVYRHVEDIVPEGKFNLFKSPKQKLMINAFKNELFHSSMQMSRASKSLPILESVSTINELIRKQSDLVERIKNTVDDSTVRKTYNIDSRLKLAEQKLNDLTVKKESLMKGLNLTEKDLPKASSVEESNKIKEYLIGDLNLTEEKRRYDKLLEVTDNKSLEKWFDSKVKKQEEIKSEISPEQKVSKDFAKQQEQRTSNEAQPKGDEQPATTETKPVEIDIQKELDKLDKQEDAEIEALYRADVDDIDNAVEAVLNKYKAKREALVNKTNKEQSAEEKKDKKEQEETLKSEEKDDFSESKEFNETIAYEKTAIDALFDLQGKIAKWWNKTAAGEDNDKKLPEQRYFRFLERNKLPEGTGLQLVTRKSNKKLFDQIFDKGAEDYEKSTGIETIYTVFVDKDNNPIYSKQDGTIITDGSGTADNLVYATMLTEIGVNDTVSGDKEAAIKELNKFRKQVLLQTSPVRVNVIKKSDGILIREKTESGKRRFNPALGYITSDIKRDGLLELPTIVVGDNNATRLAKNGQKAQARKLYAYDDNGIGIDLMARNLTDSESAVLINLIQQRLGNLPRQKEVDDIGKEIDKLVYFGVPESGAKEYTIGIKDNKLYVGKDKVFTKEDMLLPENQEYVSNFLIYKKYVNANSKIPFNSSFREPLLNAEGNVEFKDWGSYQEYLLSNEGNRLPLFGTDIPALGKPKFRNYYVTYDPTIINESIKLKESDIKPDLTPEYSTEIKTSLDDKKSDIERRRQEELRDYNTINFEELENSEFKYRLKDNKGIVLHKSEIRYSGYNNQLEFVNTKDIGKWLSKWYPTEDYRNTNISDPDILFRVDFSQFKEQLKKFYSGDGVKFLKEFEKLINAKYDTELKALETNKKDDTKNLENKEKSTTFVDSKTGKKTFKKSGKSKTINIEDEDVGNKDIDDAIKKCK